MSAKSRRVYVTLSREDTKWVVRLATDALQSTELITIAKSTDGVSDARLEENSQTLVIVLTSFHRTQPAAKRAARQIAISLGFSIIGSVIDRPTNPDQAQPPA